jgi:glyoxylase-like metal-dependent hydrolase (beta-lactamase superfamily II)
VVVGSLQVDSVVDGVAKLGELAELYPEVGASEWEPYRALYPDLFSGSEWRLATASFVIRDGERTILVDTGLGPAGLTGWEVEREGELLQGLAALGLGPDDVDVVFLTHLHIDHVGWNADAEGAVAFPRARYLAHPDAVTFASTQDGRPHVQRCILPFVDRFEAVGDGSVVAPGVVALELPGHYPGHLGLRIVSDGSRLDLIADAAVHPALLDQPGWGYVSDIDGDASAATRRALLPELVDRDVLVGCGHYPGSGIGRVVTRDGRVVFEASA